MFRLIKRNEDKPDAFFVIVPIVIIIVIGLIDYATGNEFSFSVFYLLALGLAAWCVGKGFAYFISIFSVAVSLAGDLAAGPHYSNLLVPFWNAFIVLAFYLVVVSLLTRLRSLTKVLESRVRERTAALTDEIVERERLERELLEISEREQRRIGHDLHDSLGQHLTGTALAGQVLEEKLSARNLPEAADAAKVVELVEEGIALTRKLAKGLHPIEMEADGLMQALEELSSTSMELFKVSCRFECESPVLIKDAATAGHLYRITQESISNAIKHGKAKNIVISLETIEDGLSLKIKDDGSGLPDLLPKNAGIGLRIMAHRASMIGAMFNAKRDTSGGTIVSCSLKKNDNSETICE
ncbi:MAG: sensor histidine kinase [Verrucomicrobiota bacterium]|nr:sensor histidine kinase [Verrucomicrobiota bacterium]